MCESKRWVGVNKIIIPLPGTMAIFKLEIFLNIENNRNTLAMKSVEKKSRWPTNVPFL
jgi:hypothetical protein